MRAPTFTAEKYGQPRNISRRPPDPGPDDAKTQGSAAGNAPLQLGGEAFFPTSQLSRPAQPSVPVALESADLRMVPLTGVSVLTVWIDSRGNVVQTAIESSDVPGPLAQLAAEAFRKTPFIPGERNGRPVGTVMRIEVRYEDLVDLPA